jgi:predicted NBD/HSP70 family sugar kinase
MATKTAAGPTSADESRGRPLADLVLEYVWHQREVSRADIARSLGLSRSTVSEIAASLLETGLVREGRDGPSSGGRRPVLLQFRDDAASILGIDMGASHVSVAVTDLRGRVEGWATRPHPVRTDPGGTRLLMVDLCEKVLEKVPGGRDKLMGIGIAVPSPVDPRRPFSMPDAVMPAWRGRTGFEELANRYKVPVFVDNDANLGALAEHWWGGARGMEDFTYIKLATGVGSGLMIRGEIYRGATSVAGEVGHVSIDPKGTPCICGNRGCLSTFISSSALLTRASRLLPEYPESELAGIALNLTALEDAALADDPLALLIFEEAARHLGDAVAGILNLLNPAAVILGGSITRIGDRLVRPLRERVLRRTLVQSLAASEIRVTELGEQAFAVGAATYVLDEALKRPSLFPGLAA